MVSLTAESRSCIEDCSGAACPAAAAVSSAIGYSYATQSVAAGVVWWLRPGRRGGGVTVVVVGICKRRSRSRSRR